jgi:hypothetical protein
MLSSNDNVVPEKPNTIFVNIEYLTSNILPFSPGSIYNLISKKRLPFPYYKIGGKICFKYNEVIKWANTVKDLKNNHLGASTKVERRNKRLNSESQSNNSQPV